MSIHMRLLSAVATLGQSALTGADLQPLFDRAVSLVATTLEIEYSKVLELLPGDGLKLVAGVGWKAGLVGKAMVDMNRDSQAGFTLLTGGPVIVEDLSTEKRFTGPALLRDHGVVSGISVIIGDPEKPFGVLGAHSPRQRVFSRIDEHFFQSVAHVLGEAVQRKRQEQTITQARDFYLKLFDEFPTPIWRAGIDAKSDYFNRAWLDFTGRTLEQELDERWTEGVHPEDLDGCLTTYLEVFKTRQPFEMTYRLRTSDGEHRWIIDFGRPFHDLEGNFAGYVGACFDIHEQKRAEAELRESAQSYATLVKNINGAVYRRRNDLDRTVEFISEGCLEMTGYRPDEIVGNRVTSLGAIIHPGDAPTVWEKCQANLAARQTCSTEYRIIHRNGEVRWVWDQAQGLHSASGDLLVIEGLITDITERKQAEEKLLSSETRYRNVFVLAPVGIYQSRRDGTFITANKTLVEMLGYDSVDELLQMNIGRDVYFAESEREAIINQNEDRGYASHLELQWKKKNGAPIWVQLSAHAIKGPNRTTEYFEGFVRDITERKLAEEYHRSRLKELTVLYDNSLALGQRLSVQVISERAVTALESLLDWRRGSVWLIDDTGEKIELLAHSAMGLDEEALEIEVRRVRELVGRSGQGISGWVALHGESVRSGNVKNHHAYVEADPIMQSELCVPLKTGGGSFGSINVESEKPNAFSEQDERLLTTLANQVAIAIENTRFFEKLERELVERKRAEEALKTSRGQLRALVARLQRTREEERIRVSREIHDELGQLLTSLKMDTRWLERKLSEPGVPPAFNPLLDRAVEASELANTAIATVQKIASQLRPTTLEKLGLGPALDDEARRFQERSGVQCRVVAQETLPMLSPEVGNQLFYICREALTNVARHAQSTSVEIYLRTDVAAIVLEVHDNGVGMSEAALNSPHSLGLTGMRERAVQCGGTASFTANDPQGTRVTVRVPRPTVLSAGGDDP